MKQMSPSITPTATDSEGKKTRKRWKKPKDKPKRPLSAYNIFFAYQRQKLVNGCKFNTGFTATASSPGFAGLARIVASKWKTLDEDARMPYEEEARREKLRYQEELELWKSGKSLEAELGNSEDKDLSIFAVNALPKEVAPLKGDHFTWVPPAIASSSSYSNNGMVKNLQQLPMDTSVSDVARDDTKPHAFLEGKCNFVLSPNSAQPSQITELSMAALISGSRKMNQSQANPMPLIKWQSHEIEDAHNLTASSLRLLFETLDDDEVDFVAGLRFA